MVLPPYTNVYRLLEIAASNWSTFDGRYTQSGLDPFSLPFYRFLNLINATLTESVAMDEKERVRMEQRLSEPIPGRRESASDAEDEMALFKASTQS